MPAQKYSQFFITIRPRDGVKPDLIERVAKYCKRAYKEHFLWSEKTDDERHLHLVATTKNPKTVSNAKVDPYTRWWKQFGWDSPEELERGVKVTPCWDADWIEQYFPEGEKLLEDKLHKKEEAYQVISGDRKMKLNWLEKKKAKSEYVYNSYLSSSVKALWDDYMKTHTMPDTGYGSMEHLYFVEEFLRIQMYCVPMKMNMCKTQRAFKDLAKNVYLMVIAPSREDAMKNGFPEPFCMDSQISKCLYDAQRYSEPKMASDFIPHQIV